MGRPEADAIKRIIEEATPVEGAMCRCIYVTPEIAAQLMQFNTHNRGLSTLNVARYATEMLEGEWMLTGSGIGFDSEGCMGDGQHRLSGVQDSGVTVPMLVAYELDPKAQEKVDRQKKRSVWDIAKLSGICDSATVVKIVANIILLKKPEFKIVSAIPDSALLKMLEVLKSNVEPLLKVVGNGMGKRKFKRVGFMSAVTLYQRMYPEKAIAFLDRVVKGEMLAGDDPEMLIRRYLMGESYHKVAGNGNDLRQSDYQKTNYAIVKFHQGEKINRLRGVPNLKDIVPKPKEVKDATESEA